LVPERRGIGFDQLHLAGAEVQQHRLLQPFVDLPAALAVGLGDAELALLQAFDHALDGGPGRALDLVHRQHRAPLPGAIDAALALLVLVVRRDRLRRGPGFHHLPCRDLLCRGLLRRGLLRCLGRLLLRRLLRLAHDLPSPSRQASSASRKACCCWGSTSARSRSSVIWNTSSARSPKVAMRASCTRRRWSRSTRVTSASRPGRSVETRLSRVRSPWSVLSKPICGTSRKWRRCRGCARRGGRTASRSVRDSASCSARSTDAGSTGRCGSDGKHSKGSNPVPLSPSNSRACWVASPSRSSEATIAANRPSRSGACTNTSSAP